MKTSKEIKFRVFDKTTGVIDFSQIAISNSNGALIINPNVVAMMFTGYYDMDGKEIYEGDLLLFKGHGHTGRRRNQIHEVYWDLERGAWKTRPQYEGGQINRLFNSIVQNNHAVCGNIYQNPELVINHE